jgi:murein DD-endopeptidase MepM/ murein hydrolase activator NlpD
MESRPAGLAPREILEDATRSVAARMDEVYSPLAPGGTQRGDAYLGTLRVALERILDGDDPNRVRAWLSSNPLFEPLLDAIVREVVGSHAARESAAAALEVLRACLAVRPPPAPATIATRATEDSEDLRAALRGPSAFELLVEIAHDFRSPLTSILFLAEALRDAETLVTRDLQVRLEPPTVAVLSTFHYINLGGSEFVVYRAAPEDVVSGVRVGDKEYLGYPARGAGIASDPALRVAFFALLYDQPANTQVQLFARDEAGNQAVTPLDHMVFNKVYQQSRIEIDDRFLQRVVPAIAANVPDANIPTDDPLAGFLAINGELRRRNNQYLRELASKSAPELMFTDAFQQLGNSQVEAKFADTRTYIYKGKPIDKQVHLGFDLAVTANVPLVAAHRGIVVHASDLGIYGNCVVIDHGMGVQSLYGHLSSIGVKVGDRVEKGQDIGRSGMTGLAGGDHLHFTMLVGGEQVTPVDWWSAQWMQDRVRRKVTAAGGPGGQAP